MRKQVRQRGCEIERESVALDEAYVVQFIRRRATEGLVDLSRGRSTAPK